MAKENQINLENKDFMLALHDNGINAFYLVIPVSVLKWFIVKYSYIQMQKTINLSNNNVITNW